MYRLLVLLSFILMINGCVFIKLDVLEVNPASINEDISQVIDCDIPTLDDGYAFYDVDRKPFARSNDSLGYTIALLKANKMYRTALENIIAEYKKCSKDK